MLLAAFTTQAIVLPSTLADLGSSVPRNVILFYDDCPSRGDPEFQITREIALPLVAHLDQDGKATDWMFDSLIFYSIFLYVTNHPTQSYIDSWIKYIFDGGQITNLDSTVAEVKASLGQPDYRMNVFLTVPVVFNATETSGILVNVSKMLDRWKSLNPANLNLVGFYWGFDEELCDEPSYGVIVPAIANYAHSNGYKLLIAPYAGYAWCGQAYQDLHSFGFDYVTIQPNYAWDASSSMSDFTTANKRIVQGLADGAELELPINDKISCCGGDWRANLRTYLEQAYTYRWNRNTINVYYHGSDISFMGRNTNSDYRTAYEAIYEFIRSSHSIISLSARLDTSSSPPTVEISGSIYPAPGGPLNVTLEFSSNQGETYQEMAHVTSAPNGTFSYSWKAPGNGVFMIRADAQGVKRSAVSVGTSGVPGFSLESLLVGCALGLLFAIMRRRQRSSTRVRPDHCLLVPS